MLSRLVGSCSIRALLFLTLSTHVFSLRAQESQAETQAAVAPDATEASAHAIVSTAEPFTVWRSGATFSGDWGGLRSTVRSAGIEPFVFYTAIASGNPRGGYSQGHVTAADDFYMGARFDLGKLVRWNGATLTLSGVNRDGKGLSNEYIKSQFNVQQCVGGQSLFFYQLFVKQRLHDDRSFIKVCRFGASDDFNASPIYGLYLNNGINGDIRNVLFNTQFSAYPFATWAGMYQTTLSSGVTLQAGVFQTWKNIFHSELNGMDWSIHHGDGVIAILQAGVTTHIHDSRGARLPSPDASSQTAKSLHENTDRQRLEGHYWLGTTYSPWKGFARFNSKELASNSYGFYGHADQRVWEESPGSRKNVALWGAFGYYPQQSIAIVPLQINLGAIYQGMISRRPEDKTIFGVIYGRFSTEYAKKQKASGQGDPSYEAVIEASHRIQLSKFFFTQPDLQWVIRPSGTGRYRNALAAGMEMGISW